ncbi:MAG: 50S ribosomal protein L5 [Candidatus Margulisiibacteriota bacterium]
MNDLKEKYLKKIVPEMTKRFKYKNVNQVPHLVKIVISEGISEGVSNPKATETAAAELAEITGQKPLITRAKKSISAFKLKARDPIGCVVTIRGERMFLFLNKLINVSLPKIRDFKGLSPKSFDGMGNYNFGIKEQLIFPEVNYDRLDKVRGMNITIVTTAKKNEEAQELLKQLGIPFMER